MNDEFQNTEQLIAALKARTTGGLVTSGTVALLNVIPYAGGAVVRPSPLEASRTKLGHDFSNFCTGG